MSTSIYGFGFKRGQTRDRLLRNLEENRIDFDPDAIVPDRHRSRYRGTATHEGVKHDSSP